MIYVYSIRHAPRMEFTKSVSDLDTGLSTVGHELAEKQMAPALRKDIDEILKAHPGQDYSIEFIFAPSARTVQTKDHLLAGLKGLTNITQAEDARFGHGDLGKFFGLSESEKKRLSPHAELLSDPEFKKDTSMDFASALITGGNSKQDVLQDVIDALRPHKLEPSTGKPPLRFKIFVGHSLSCQSLRSSLTLDSFGSMLNYEKVQPGCIRRFHSETMHIMHDDGVIFEGAPERSGERSAQPAARAR